MYSLHREILYAERIRINTGHHFGRGDVYEK